jgi:hypothetical protein
MAPAVAAMAAAAAAAMPPPSKPGLASAGPSGGSSASRKRGKGDSVLASSSIGTKRLRLHPTPSSSFAPPLQEDEMVRDMLVLRGAAMKQHLDEPQVPQLDVSLETAKRRIVIPRPRPVDAAVGPQIATPGSHDPSPPSRHITPSRTQLLAADAKRESLELSAMHARRGASVMVRQAAIRRRQRDELLQGTVSRTEADIAVIKCKKRAALALRDILTAMKWRRSYADAVRTSVGRLRAKASDLGLTVPPIEGGKMQPPGNAPSSTPPPSRIQPGQRVSCGALGEGFVVSVGEVAETAEGEESGQSVAVKLEYGTIRVPIESVDLVGDGVGNGSITGSSQVQLGGEWRYEESDLKGRWKATEERLAVAAGLSVVQSQSRSQDRADVVRVGPAKVISEQIRRIGVLSAKEDEEAAKALLSPTTTVQGSDSSGSDNEPDSDRTSQSRNGKRSSRGSSGSKIGARSGPKKTPLPTLPAAEPKVWEANTVNLQPFGLPLLLSALSPHADKLAAVMRLDPEQQQQGGGGGATRNGMSQYLPANFMRAESQEEALLQAKAVHRELSSVISMSRAGESEFCKIAEDSAAALQRMDSEIDRLKAELELLKEEQEIMLQTGKKRRVPPGLLDTTETKVSAIAENVTPRGRGRGRGRGKYARGKGRGRGARSNKVR